MIRHVLFAFSLLAATSAFAGEYGFATDGMIAEIDSAESGGKQFDPPAETFFGALPTRGGTLTLFEDRLEDVQQKYRGTIQSWEDSGYHMDWLCYVADGQRVWYLSEDGEVIDWLVAEPSNPATDASYGCKEEPRALLAPGDFPTVGATIADLERQFGTRLDLASTRLFFFNQTDDAVSVVTTAQYRLIDGRVDAVSLTRWTSE